MNPSINKELLLKYLNDACTDAERERVELWLVDPANEAQVKEIMEQQWNEDNSTVTSADLAHILGRLDEHMQTSSAMDVVSPGKVQQRFLFPRVVWRVAAAVLVLVISAGTYFLSVHSDNIPDTTTWQTESTMISHNKISQLVLPDGTKVWLNAKSEIKYLPAFGNERREVFLKGEAYFDVTEDKNRPFIVYTNDVQVRVLGTAFTVKAYDDEQTTETTLMRGKVSVQKKGLFSNKAVELVPNQRAVYSRASSELVASNVEANKYDAWRSGTLVFDNESITSVIRVLERWYNVKIHFDESTSSDCRLTARVDGESLEEMLELLRSNNGVEYTISDNEVFIKGKICN